MSKQYYLYILSNSLRTVLYIGITSDLCKRLWEHKEEIVDGFTKKYHVHYLLYFENYADPQTAIEREKQLKKWNRKKKELLIAEMNPQLRDLTEEICR